MSILDFSRVLIETANVAEYSVELSGRDLDRVMACWKIRCPDDAALVISPDGETSLEKLHNFVGSEALVKFTEPSQFNICLANEKTGWQVALSDDVIALTWVEVRAEDKNLVQDSVIETFP